MYVYRFDCTIKMSSDLIVDRGASTISYKIVEPPLKK